MCLLVTKEEETKSECEERARWIPSKETRLQVVRLKGLSDEEREDVSPKRQRFQFRGPL